MTEEARGTNLDSYLIEFENLLEEKLVHKLVEVEFYESVKEAIGVVDPELYDAPVYAIY